MTDAERANSEVNARLREVLAVHFDPDAGTPHWLDRARELGFDPREEIRTIADLPRLGRTEPVALAERPLPDYLPRGLHERRAALIVGQTGGTLGRPVWTAYLEDEFAAAFVTPFVVAARHVGFPQGGCWLYAGPSGPHLIGRAAERIARATGAAAPFSVDFDPRWAKALLDGSFAARRYLEHVVTQALDVISSQPIDVLFTTPRVLERLADEMTPAQRERIRGVHYGGMALAPDVLERFQRDAFPNAVHLSGYGNTLFGCCLELSADRGRVLRYYPHGRRLVFGTVAIEERGTAIGRQDAGATLAHKRTGRKPSEGAAEISYDHPAGVGRLVFSRLDRTMLLVNVVERDQGRLVAPPGDAPDGYSHCGVEALAPITSPHSGPSIGLY